MSALVGLGLRLARAGGRLRAWSIAGGNAVGVVLLLVALAVPAALYPDPGDRTASRFQVLGAMTLLLVPAAVLLVTVGRLSSGVRDRRLATLRMLGVSKRQVRAAAAVENAVLALLGTLAGTALFTVAAPAVADVAGFAGPLRASPAVSAGAVAAVMALSALVGTAATWNRTLPGAARSAATRRTPGRWRLVPLAVGVAALAWQATVDVERTSDDLQIAALLGGTATTAVGIALATPLATAWLAGRLTRRRSLALLLAGRAVQTDSAGAARVVAGLGVALFLSVGALGELGAFQNAPQYRYAVQAYGAGPQQIDVATGTGEAGPLPTFSSDDLASLSAVPGVLGLVPDHWLRATAGDRSVLPVFTGTCAELALVVEAAGCDDSRAARIEPDTRDLAGADWLWFPDASVLADATEVASSVVDVDDRGDRRRVDLSGPPIVEHTG